jgi:hypothetical protein
MKHAAMILHFNIYAHIGQLVEANLDAVESEIIQLLPAQTKTNFSRLKRRCKQILKIKREINPGCGLLCFYVTPSDIEDIKEQKLL